MKKLIVFQNTKLTLEKRTISQLDENQLSFLKGGFAAGKAKTSCFSDGITCGTTLANTYTCPVSMPTK